MKGASSTGKPFPGRHVGLHLQGLVDQLVHPRGLAFEIALLKFRREGGTALRIVTVLLEERVQAVVERSGVIFVEHRRIGAAQTVHRVAGVGVAKHDRVGRGPDQFGIVRAFDDLVRSLADAQSLFRERLIEGDVRPAAAAAQQHDCLGADLFLQILDRGLEILRHLPFPVDGGFIVDRVGVEAENDDAPLRHLPIDQGADAVIVHPVVDPVDRNHRDGRIGIHGRVRHIEGALRLIVEVHKLRRRKVRALRLRSPNPAGDHREDGKKCSDGS